MADTQGCREGELAVLSSDVKDFIQRLGSAKSALFGALPYRKSNTVIFYFPAFVLKCAVGVHKINPEQYESSNAGGIFLPQSLSKDFAILMPQAPST